jgi:2-amino-4-hydroxy-6-hydroxymethyldihydropteridine diphosphokinase
LTLTLTIAAIAFGSNLGDRASHLAFACDRLERVLTGLRVSSLIETEPMGVPGPQPAFLNGAAVGHTEGSPRELLEALLSIERERGRERPFAHAARTLDLDLVLFGDAVIEEPRMTVPHPRFREREFVLAPLAEIAPDLRDPKTGQTVRELLATLRADARR